MATRKTAVKAVEETPTPETRYEFPQTLGACADLYYTLREKRLGFQREADALAAQETALREHIIQTLPKSEANGIAGKKCRVTVVVKPIPRVADWAALQEYIKKNAAKGAFALLQRRVNEAAVKEIWEAGKKVPGVEVFNNVTLSVNKL